MFDIFSSVFFPDPQPEETDESRPSTSNARDPLRLLLSSFGGKSFNQGRYRIIQSRNVDAWNDLALSAFPQFTGRISCFAVDWLGRIFAVDSARLESDLPGVLMIEPGTGESLEIPCNIVTFHENELVNYSEEALADSFYRQWVASGGSPPGIAQCVGYKTPLFLGGLDVLDNLHLADLDVYWTIAAQLIQETKGLPPGAALGSISII